MIVLLLSACNSNLSPFARRADKTSKVIIGIAWPPFGKAKEINLFTGARLAVKEWNNRCTLTSNNNKAKPQQLEERCDKFLQNRKIELKEESEPMVNSDKNIAETKRHQIEQNKTYEIAQKFANNLNMIAVIGHRSSSQAIQASITYEHHGIVFLAPTATNLALTNHNFKYVFRLMPNNDELSAKMTDYLKSYHYKRVALIYERSVYAEEFAESFSKNANNKFDIIFQQSFFKTEEQFTDMLAKLKEKSFLLDAIFLVTDANKACKIVKQAHAINITTPFIGGDAMFKPSLEECPAAANTVVPTILNESTLHRFQDKLALDKVVKDVESISNTEYQQALLGYDAINLLIHAIRQAQSLEPQEIANQLRYMEPWQQGILGEYAFKLDGNLKRENAINFAILCPKPQEPQKLFFKISSNFSSQCNQ